MDWWESLHGLAVACSHTRLVCMDVQAKELRGGLWIHRGQMRGLGASAGPRPLKDVRNLPEQNGKVRKISPRGEEPCLCSG